MSFPWNDESDAVLKELHARRMGYTSIGDELQKRFNHEASRNAVAGRVKRLGLSLSHEGMIAKRKAVAGETKRKRKRNPRAETKPGLVSVAAGDPIRPAKGGPPAFPDPLPETPMEDHNIPASQRRSIFDLTESKCRWPVGDPGKPGFFFCGGKTDDGMPYCGWHCGRAFNNYAPRRKHAA